MGIVIVVVGIAGCGRSQPDSGADGNAPVARPKEVQEQTESAPTTDVEPAKTQAEKLNASEFPAEENALQATEPDEATEDGKRPDELDVETEELIEPVPLPAPEGAVQLSPTEEVWINRDKQEVYVGGQVALRQGMLEMFACKKGTKEHESVVALNSLAATIHAALLAVGAVPGTPVSYDPEDKPPTGTEIDITVEWKDPQGEWHSANAREWVRNVRTGEELDVPWVFAGSGFYKDEETGKEHYLAESGDVICVSNFGTAMLDLPVESTRAEAGLLFEAFTERVPALGTPVRLVLRPKVDKEDES